MKGGIRRGGPADRAELLERERELAAIAEQVEAACAGEGSVALIEGPAGIGKTCLIEEARRHALEHGMQVLAARGSELEREFSFGVVRQLFEPVVARAEEGERASLLAGAASQAAALVDGSDANGAPRAGALQGALHSLYWLCANVASEGPLLLAVDDAHWADEPSLRWLSYVVARLEGLPILVAVGVRPAEADDALMAALAADRQARVLEPPALSSDAVGRLVREQLAPDADDAFCAACHEATRGNPFLTRELLAALAADDGGAGAGTPERVRQLGSSSVSRSVLGRLGRLPPDAAALTRAVAVLGEGAELPLAAGLSEVDSAPAADAADALARMEILGPDRPLVFVHPLVRASVYESIPAAERSRLHARAARLLADAGVALEQVAVHLLATEPSGDDWVASTLHRVGRQAAARGAAQAAVTHLRRALHEPPPVDQRAELLLALGSAEAECLAPEADGRLAAALDAAGSPEARAEAALELGRALALRERPQAAIEVLDRGLEALGAHNRELALRLEADGLTVANESIERLRLAGPRADRLLPVVKEGATPAERLVLGGIAWERAMSASAPATEVIELAERALAGGEMLTRETAESPTFYGTVAALGMSDRLADAGRHLTDALAEGQRRSSARAFAIASCWRSWVHYRRGSLAEAEADARASLGVAAEYGWGMGVGVSLGMLVESLVGRGKADQATVALDRWWDESRLGGSTLLGGLLAARGRLRVLLGELDAALEDFQACGRRHAAWGIENPAAGAWRSGAARLLGARGEVEEARRLAAEELEIARAYGAPRNLGMALRTAGLVDEGARARELLEEAVAVLEGSEARLEYARALHSLGTALAAEGKRREARAPLRQSLDLAHRCACPAFAELARQALVAAGGRPRRALLSGVAALTPSELRIARMAEGGLTNREIAEQQFLTLRMVEVHLTNAYRKLGISSRKELGGALAEAGAGA